MLSERLKMPRQQSMLYCDHELAGLPITPQAFAASWRASGNLAELVRWGFDINFRDPKTGGTMLDYWHDRMSQTFEANEAAGSPAGRMNFPPMDDLVLIDNYWQYRGMGALHARELGQDMLGPCGPTAADAPAPGAPYTGELSDVAGGDTPTAIPGVTTVSARQAACLLNHLGPHLLVLEVMNEPVGIPGSFVVASMAAGPPIEGKAQAAIVDFMEVYTRDRGEKRRPTLVYCHGIRCRMSYNAALRLKHAGYERIYWLREGGAGWERAGMPLERPTGYVAK
jgi:rhodanese-related sulfurtransferase